MIWITGARGMLGRQLVEESVGRGLEILASDLDVDIASMDALARFIRGHAVEWVINCAAFTAVDRAESEAKRAFAVNAAGAGNVAAVAEAMNAKLIHFSTDYVFSGKKNQLPYQEEDRTDPATVYGESKLEGERRVMRECGKFFLIRTSWLYGVYGNNFVKKIYTALGRREPLRVVNDQTGLPTYAGLLARNLIEKVILPGSDRYGLFHYADEGAVTWHEFACEIRNTAIARGWISEAPLVTPVTSSEFPQAAPRPAYSVLDQGKIRRELGFDVRPWRENLRDYFIEEEKRGNHG